MQKLPAERHASYGTNPGAMLLLLALSILLSGATLGIFARRDVGGTLVLPGFLRRPERAVRPARALPVNARSLRSVYTRSLGMIVAPACWWTLGIAGFAGWMVVIDKQTETNMVTMYKSSPILKDFLTRVGGGDATTNATILSALYVLLPLLLMAFAVTQANRWSADEEDGLWVCWRLPSWRWRWPRCVLYAKTLVGEHVKNACSASFPLESWRCFDHHCISVHCSWHRRASLKVCMHSTRGFSALSNRSENRSRATHHLASRKHMW